MNKKYKFIGIIILSILFIIGAFFIYDKTRFKPEDIQFQFDNVETLEYGQEFDINQHIQVCSGEIIQQSQIDVKKIGKQKISFTVEEKGVQNTFTYEIEVKDTKKPEINLKKEKVIIEYGETYQLQSNIKSVKDVVDGSLKYIDNKDMEKQEGGYYTITGKVNHKKSGDYDIKVIAVDKNGNQSEQSFVVHVNEKKQTVSQGETTQTKKVNPKPDYIADPNNRVIVIDAGHQGTGNNAKEAVGPGSSTMKAKVAGGATGVSSKKAESQINLEVALKLRDELQARGYTVVMTRTSQNVNISNQQRAKIGNQNKAAAVIHLHCDGAGASARGAHTISITNDNPYCSQIYKESSRLAKSVINAYCQKTGIKNRGVSYRDDLTGLNWSEVPAIYLEMGFITNSTEDKLLSDPSFQYNCAKGIANGIDQYFQ